MRFGIFLARLAIVFTYQSGNSVSVTFNVAAVSGLETQIFVIFYYFIEFKGLKSCKMSVEAATEQVEKMNLAEKKDKVRHFNL